MSKHNAIFGEYKISERKRDGANKRTIFYLTPKNEKCQNIDEYSQRYLIAIKRDYQIERYPECIPSDIALEIKTEIIDYLKERNLVLEKQHEADRDRNITKYGIEEKKVVDFDVFEDIF
jgi:hypothetical protein